MITLSMLGTATGALILVIALLAGLAVVARRLDLPGRLGQGLPIGIPTGARRSCRIDRTRTLSIVELGGIRFAILSGGVSDHLLILPPSSERDAS